MSEKNDRQRIDKWLFFTRIVKSRSLAAKLAAGGKVRVNRKKIDQPSHQIKVGDVLTVTLERRIVVCRVLQPGNRRGPASEARLLFEDLSPPPEPKETPPAKPSVPTRDPGSGRPTKRERREIERRWQK
ncbi:MAG: RNA-binding S4 domain-containing protein [Rhizobiaceae bacterium]